MLHAYFEGKIVPEQEALVHIKTNSLHYGTAVFEGIRGYFNPEKKNTGILFAKEHYTRLLKSAEGLFMQVHKNPQELVEITRQLIRNSEVYEDVYIRPLVYFRDVAVVPKLHDYTPEISMLLYKLGKYLDTSRGIRAGVSTYRRNDDNAVPTGIKVCGSYVNSALAKTESVKNGFDEAILLNSRGSVAEGSGENIFLVKNGKIITPDLSQHILPGLTRSAILSIARQEGIADIEERQVARGELYNADEIFLTGTAAEITPVIEVDRKKIGSGEVGRVTAQLQKIYFDAVRGKNEKYNTWLTMVF